MSKYFIPILFLVIFVFAIIKRVKPYDAFTLGAKSALPFAVSLFPYLVSIFVITELFEVSGISNAVSTFISPLLIFVFSRFQSTLLSYMIVRKKAITLVQKKRNFVG